MTNSWIFGRRARLVAAIAAGASLAACASIQPRYPTHGAGPETGQAAYKVGKPYQVGGVWYVPREQPDYDVTGTASWYGDEFHQKTTANGERFDMNAVTAAHTTLPLPSMVEVTNLENGRKLTVRVNDRGPFVGDRIIDLSREAARQLGYERAGLARVRVRFVGPAPLLGPDAGVRYASAPVATRPRADMALQVTPLPPPAPVTADILAQPLPPITGAEISSAPVATAVAGTTSSGLRIQAGAFSSEAGAQRAVSRLSPAGAASIEPLQRDGSVLYRVMLPAPADEAAAYALRDRVAEIGFTDARVVRTF
jgi:peptidoglycan lytic transglycosylase